MSRTPKVWACAFLVAAAAGLASGGDSESAFPSLILSVGELIRYPQPPGQAEFARLHVAVLPETDRAVLLRPIGEEEFASYQVQAIAAETIDHRLLAAAFVVPAVTEQDAAALPVELVRFAKQAVNRISRFRVFHDVGAP